MKNTTNNFRVIRNIYWRRNKWIHEKSMTHEFEIDKIETNNFKIEIRNFTFKAVDNEVVFGAPAQFIQEYTKEIYPIVLDVKQQTLTLCNYKNIREKLKTKKESLLIENIENEEIDHTNIINEI